VAARRQLGSSEPLPALVARLGLDWAGFRRVQGTVRKRLRRRVRQLGLQDVEAYVAYLATAPDEWQRLDALCRIPISRFYRDGFVFDHLAQTVLRDLAEQALRENRKRIRVWSAGCASGEEPYSIAIAWRVAIQAGYPDIELDVLGTDLDASMLERARRGCYPRGTLRELPEQWRQAAFDAQGGVHCLRQAFRVGVRFECADLRSHVPEGPFDIVSCRNLAFTYFDEGTRVRVANALIDVMRARGVLVIGAKEALPPNIDRVRERHRGIYEKRADGELL
jgi:chemotaxis protein methyltransferase CheR